MPQTIHSVKHLSHLLCKSSFPSASVDASLPALSGLFFCLSLFWCKLHAQHHTPRFTSNSTLNIILHASHHTPRSKHHTPRFTSNSTQHQTPRSLHTTPIKLATTRHHQTAPATMRPCGHDPRGMDGETARFPAKMGKERGRTLSLLF